MVFSSLPLYLDPPNWQHHPQQQGGSTSGNNENPQILPPPPGPAAPPPHIGMVVGGGGGVGMAPTTSIRPNSMAEKARLAKIPPPEAPLKCPRCDSTNTKFCYFNNYSLSQPRHFCKTCRRYWTRGGALRNVPVGGVCRRNKRSKSRSTAATTAKSTLDGQSPTTTGGATCTTSPMMISDIHHLPQTNTPISLMAASLQNLTHLGISNFNPIDYSSTNNNPNFLSGLENWRMNPTQNFPNFLAGFEIPSSSSVAANSGLYPFQNEEAIDNNSSKNELGPGSYGGIVSPGEIIRSKISSGLISQLGQVKMEEGQLNFQKQLMGMSGNNGNSNNNNNNNNDNNNSNISNSNQFWGTGGGTISTNTSSMWSDISGLNSSSHAHQHFL